MTTLKDKIKQAKELSAPYGYTLPRKWNGAKIMLHEWHKPIIYNLMSYENHVDRVIEICTQKPEHERKERLSLIKPSTYKFDKKGVALWSKGYALKSKGDALWSKGYALKSKGDALRSKGNALWSKGYALKSKGDALKSKGYALKSKGDALWSKGYALWSKGYALRSKGDALWSKGYALWSKGDALRSKGDALWSKGYALMQEEINKAHAHDCPTCKWDGEKLPQFEAK